MWQRTDWHTQGTAKERKGEMDNQEHKCPDCGGNLSRIPIEKYGDFGYLERIRCYGCNLVIIATSQQIDAIFKGLEDSKRLDFLLKKDAVIQPHTAQSASDWHDNPRAKIDEAMRYFDELDNKQP